MSWRAHGLRAWLLQRLSAVYMLFFGLYFFIRLASRPPDSYGHWLEWMGRSSVAVPTAVFFIAILLHAWVGIRDVLIDYVHNWWLRISLLALLGLALFSMGLWVARILIIVGVSQ